MGNAVCGVFKPTNVISISYGAPESAYPAAYLKRQCNEYIRFPKPQGPLTPVRFLKLGLQGVSVIVSSGHRGVSEVTGCLGDNATIFSPSYPAK